MNEGYRLFVYGQLRRGQIGHQRLGLEARTCWLGEARLHGRLYDLGDYPGLILGGSDIVHGELVGFDDPALWPLLDEYEDYNPAQPACSEYIREEVRLLGGMDHAWAYIYGRSVEGRPLMPSGVWQASLDRARPAT